MAPALGWAPHPPSKTQSLVPVQSRKGRESKLFGLGVGWGCAKLETELIFANSLFSTVSLREFHKPIAYRIVSQ